MDVKSKLKRLTEIIMARESAVVAFSGGVDSTFLLKIARDQLGDKVLAVTGCSLSFPERELTAARQFTEEQGIEHVLINSEELDLPGFADNPPNRCYLCKKELFGKIKKLAASRGLTTVMEASNIDDQSDYRPGLKALTELEIFSPLREAGLTKSAIRALSKEAKLKTWDRPSFACLASRFPYGETLTPDKLRRVDEAERFLLERGFGQVRVRCHDRIARIEVDDEGMGLLADKDLRLLIYERFNFLGFSYTALDLRGYRSGSLNEPLSLI